MIADHNYKSFHRWRSNLALITMPLQYLVTVPVDIVSNSITKFIAHQNLVIENARLHAQVLLLNARLQQQYAIESDNQSLRALLGSSTKIPGRVTEAQLLAVSSNPFNPEVVLNKGIKDDVFVGQPLLDVNGVMGQVVQVDRFSSRVMLITSSKSAIPVQISRTGFRTIAVGDSSLGTLKLQHVTHTTDVKVGDLVVSSGLGQHYPFGYPVGVVKSIHHDPGEDFADIIISPAAHLNRSRLVLLVWPLKNNADYADKKKSQEKKIAKTNTPRQGIIKLNSKKGKEDG